ncbi:MAG: 23S rRNA (adenine(2503)-C(2))-methyltransferase RlmN [Chlamydiota bacterium]
MISIFALTQTEYAEAIQNRLGKGKLYAKKIYTEWFRTGKIDPEATLIEPQAKNLVKEIIANTYFFQAPISHVQEEGGVRKFLLKYADGLESESVILPMKFGFTLCLSSQVGCRMGCAFCETGKMGLLRSLTVEEILFQLFAAEFMLGAPIRNVVFMGMGEPFDNYEAVMQAIKVMTCSAGLSLGWGRITVSTSGKVEEIKRFTKEAHPNLHLAISLNAPNNLVRSKIMPVNNTWDLASLKEAMMDYCSHPKRKILIEYVLLEGRNDSIEAADEVASYLEGLRVTINLIPYNAQRRGSFTAPSREKIDEFRHRLQERGYNTLLRITHGSSIMAACGQLGNKKVLKTCLRKQDEAV